LFTAREAFLEADRFSVKGSGYFEVYDELLKDYGSGGSTTLIEFGVYQGGSLQMWRRLLGPSARIIGVDIDPGARRLEADGFEILLLIKRTCRSFKSCLGK